MTNGAANYTEELVLALVTTQLTAMSFPALDVQIVPFSSNFENIFGADAKIPGSARIAPFYMQFKRPNRTSPTGQIFKDRDALKLSSPDDCLNFRLRRKADASIPARKLQHNVLYRMRQRLLKRNIGDAAYVCSLFLSSADYVAATHAHALACWANYGSTGPYTNQAVVVNKTPFTFHGVPWLGGHVSIPPHATVKSASHAYSFDFTGGDVCFHSPSVVEHTTDLRSWIQQTAERARSGDAPRVEESVELLAGLREAAELHARGEPAVAPRRDRGPAGEWMAFGDALQRDYDISQFAFLFDP
ncbi:hypothetical protein JWH04_10575 [Xanthomonas melonis]|uniref:hypothetical protein n=1 Tax=Xanthomonas melonis TaxID=56456 RepID=UPI001E6201E4|nr:hypothetical protein [Xanthomonas melonis]MCD0279379.1 hypothetical protein [Xanthomonas melonis]